MKEDARPLVSVIMSVYNTPAEFLNEAIQSIIQQTYDNFEFIIINDGSSLKETLICLDQYRNKDSRVLIIDNEQNIGLTKSLNRGLSYCKGKYIARMDADDISLPHRLEKQVEYMERHKDICLLGCNTICFNDTGIICDESKSFNRYTLPGVRQIRLLFENAGYPHPTFMLRSIFLKENAISYREDIKRAQDYAITTDIILAGGKMHLLEEPLVKYREHSGQISSKSYSEQIEYQAKTAVRRLQSTFSSLSDDDCWAIARLIHEKQDYSPEECISAIKKLLLENKNLGLFNQRLLTREFKYEWYRKFMRITRINRKPWGMCKVFSISCIPTAIFVKLQNAVMTSMYKIMYK